MDFVNMLISILSLGLAIGIIVMLIFTRATHSYHAPKNEDYINATTREDKGTYAFAEKAGVYRR
ncbi:MAG: hypothetical protein K5656_11100 [Lachnospiraceae bacterium]|nr:hypothetical protein [Lachnospiraceae bacterium]